MPLLLLFLQTNPDIRILLAVNLLAVTAVVVLAAGVVLILQRRSFRRRLEEEKLVAVGAALARILHQLKNPLQTVMLQAEILQDPKISEHPEARREACEAIMSESARLTAMLQEVALWTSGSRRALALQPFALHALVQQIAEVERSEAVMQGIAMEVVIDAEATVLADAYYLRQALENLTRNAREAVAGQLNARVSLTLERNGTMARIQVRDNGPGIPPDQLGAIFRPFISTKGKGMGLGLPICKEIIEGHGGRVDAESHPGRGSVFRVLLPVYAEPGPIRSQTELPQ